MMKIAKAVSVVWMAGFAQWAAAHPGHDAPLVHNHLAAAAPVLLLAFTVV